MICNICDRQLSDKEISQHDVTKEFEPCGTCLEIAYEAAYGDGYDDSDDEFVVIESFDDDTHGDYWSWYKKEEIKDDDR
jgi:hypothetical protein